MSGIHLSMFFPYPLGQSLKVGVGNEDDKWNLTHVYEDVYMHAWGRYKSLCEGIQPDKRGQLAFYEPNLDPKMSVPMYLPPYASRITLVVQVMEDGSITQNLYSWIETEEVDAFFRLGTFADINVEQQFLAWQAYFGTPLEDWKLTQEFHDEENGFWRRKILNQSTNTA